MDRYAAGKIVPEKRGKTDDVHFFRFCSFNFFGSGQGLKLCGTLTLMERIEMLMRDGGTLLTVENSLFEFILCFLVVLCRY